VNDIFIGNRSHQSARYSIHYNEKSERHSSSGIIISTGVGSTGWLKSILAGAERIVSELMGYESALDTSDFQFSWSAKHLYFVVREPWPSMTTGASIVFGEISEHKTLRIESHMPENGVIFSDGIEKDCIEFNSGSTAEISVAPKQILMYDQT